MHRRARRATWRRSRSTARRVDARGDLFAAGAILFEMLAGRPAFVGRSVVEILHATRYEQPPALTGSPAVAAVDRVIRRALAKRPAERPPSADVDGRRAARGRRRATGTTPRALAQPLTRLVVLPFRVLRPDPETDFLAFSLPDAIATSLSGHPVARAALERGRGALRRRGARSQGAGDRGRRRPRGDGHAAACGRPAARVGAARRSAERHAPGVAYRAVLDRRSVPAPGRHRPEHRRGAGAAAGAARRPRRRPTGRTTPARTSCICGPTSWHAPTTGCRRARDLYQQMPGARLAVRARVGAPRAAAIA